MAGVGMFTLFLLKFQLNISANLFKSPIIHFLGQKTNYILPHFTEKCAHFTERFEDFTEKFEDFTERFEDLWTEKFEDFKERFEDITYILPHLSERFGDITYILPHIKGKI